MHVDQGSSITISQDLELEAGVIYIFKAWFGYCKLGTDAEAHPELSKITVFVGPNEIVAEQILCGDTVNPCPTTFADTRCKWRNVEVMFQSLETGSSLAIRGSTNVSPFSKHVIAVDNVSITQA